MRLRKRKNFDRRWAAVPPQYCEQQPETRRGRWRGQWPSLRLEIGCGKGLYLSRQAALHPRCLFIGVERDPSAALMAMELAARQGLTNAVFIHGDAQCLPLWFSENELDRIDILFCDPWPETRYAKRRLTNRRHLAAVLPLLRKDGLLCFRTDNEALFDYSLKELEAVGLHPVSATRNLHGGDSEPGESMTGYEQQFVAQGKPILQAKCTAGRTAALAT